MQRFPAPALRRWLMPAAAATLLLAQAPGAVSGPYDSDRAGGKDHPNVSRYQGSILYMYGDDAAGAAELLVADKGKPVLHSVEGRISNRIYWAPTGRSPLEVYRNYQQALKGAGFQTLFACETLQCEKLGVQPLVQELPRRVKWLNYDVFVDGTFDSGNQPGFHYISASKTVPGGVVHVQVALAGTSGDGPAAGRVRQFLNVIEPARIDLDKVAVNAKAIQDGLQRDGKIALYGVTFDTNKAVIRDESAAQLNEMAQVLKASPAMKVFIVGHTDNQGELDGNIALSQKRAQAVVDALSTRHGIAPARLSARGVASFSPLASNSGDEGRARNRRVELVVR